MKITKSLLALTLVTVPSFADTTGNVFPNNPTTEQGIRPLPDVNRTGWPWSRTYSLGSGEHFESDPSTSDQAESKEGKFHYPPKRKLFGGAIEVDDSKFLEANVYYHLTTARAKALEIGADEVDDHRVRFDVWQPYEEGQGSTRDNAYFSSGDFSIHFDRENPSHKIHTGTDASVVVHEYGHYVERVINPRYSNTGTDAEKNEARGLGEGFADFFGNYVLNTHLHSEAFHRIHNHEGGIRDAINTKKYQDIAGKEVHLMGAVFSGMAWDMRLKLGVDVYAKLIIAGIRAARAPVTYRSAVQGILVADNQLYQGAHVNELKAIFRNRGLDPDVAPARAEGSSLGSVVVKVAKALIPGW